MPLILPLAAVAIGLLCVLLVWGTGYMIRLLTNWNVGWAPIRWVIRASLALPVTLLQGMENLILPALPVVFVSFGYIAKLARSGTLEVLDAPYIRTATFKGLSRSQIVVRHVLRNALPPTISLSLLQASFIMGGLVVIEQLFTYPGLGKLLLDSSTSHDVQTLEAAVLVAGIVVMVMTLLSDLTLAVLDPRVRIGGGAR